MKELSKREQDAALVASLHGVGGLTPPLPFQQDIYLKGLPVAGSDYAPFIDELFPTLREGERLLLMREPENVYDEYAVRVDAIRESASQTPADEGLIRQDEHKLGYLPRPINKVFARLMDAGKELYAEVWETAMINKDRHLIRIRVYMRD